MAEQTSQENTLLSVLARLKEANIIAAGYEPGYAEVRASLKEGNDVLKEGNDEAKKTRADAGKTHKKREAHEKESDKDRSETHKKLGFIGGILQNPKNCFCCAEQFL